jgi:hypothetical protein
MFYGDADGTYTQKERMEETSKQANKQTNKQWIGVLLDLRTNMNLITKERICAPSGN